MANGSGLLNHDLKRVPWVQIPPPPQIIHVTIMLIVSCSMQLFVYSEGVLVAKEDFREKLLAEFGSLNRENFRMDASLIAHSVRLESEVLNKLKILEVLHSIAEISHLNTADAKQFQDLLKTTFNVALPLKVYDSAETKEPGVHRILGLKTLDEIVVLAMSADMLSRPHGVQVAKRYDKSMPLLGVYWYAQQNQPIGPLSQDHPYTRIIKNDLVKDGAIAYRDYNWKNSDEVVGGIISFMETRDVSIQGWPDTGSLKLALNKYPMCGIDTHYDIFEKFDQNLA